MIQNFFLVTYEASHSKLWHLKVHYYDNHLRAASLILYNWLSYLISHYLYFIILLTVYFLALKRLWATEKSLNKNPFIPLKRIYEHTEMSVHFFLTAWILNPPSMFAFFLDISLGILPGTNTLFYSISFETHSYHLIFIINLLNWLTHWIPLSFK